MAGKMREICFKELQFKVGKVNNISENRFPLRFRVINGKNERSFQVGMGNIDDNAEYNELLGGNGRYIAEFDNKDLGRKYPCYFEVLEFVNADDIHYSEKIGDSLRRLCGITDESKIILSPKGLDGRRFEFSECELSSEVRNNFERILKEIAYDKMIKEAEIIKYSVCG